MCRSLCNCNMETAELKVNDRCASSKTGAAQAAYMKIPTVIHTLRLATAQLLRLQFPLLAAVPIVLKTPFLFAGLLALTRRLGITAIPRARISSCLEISEKLPREQFISELEKHIDGRDFPAAQRVTVADFMTFSHAGRIRSNRLLYWMSYTKSSISAILDFMHTAQPPTQPNNSQPEEPQEPPHHPPPVDPFLPLNLCVGRIVYIFNYSEEKHQCFFMIDIGSEILIIEYGLLDSETEKDLMQYDLVVVIPYLQSKRKGDFSDQGMLICSSYNDSENDTDSEAKVRLVYPPEGAKAGDTISIPGLKVEELPDHSELIWGGDSEHLSVSYVAQITYNSKPLRTSGGALIIPTKIKVEIS